MTTDEATARTEATGTTDSGTVEWSHTAADSRPLRALVAVSLGVVVGMTVVALVSAAGLTAATFLSGRYAIALAVLLALAVTAARLAPQVTALRRGTGFRREDSTRSVAFYGAVRRLGWRGLAAASLFGVLWVGLRLGGVGSFVVVFGTIAVPMVAVAALSSEGELDPDAGTLTYRGTDVDLPALDGVRRVALGGLVAYRFSYVRGAVSSRTPRFVVVPAAVDGPLREAVDAGVAAEADDYDRPNPAVRATLAAFGVGLLAFAGALLAVDPSPPNASGGVVLVYAAVAFGVFGGIFLSLAARSG